MPYVAGQYYDIKTGNEIETMRLLGVTMMDLMQIHNLGDWKAHLQTGPQTMEAEGQDMLYRHYHFPRTISR